MGTQAADLDQLFPLQPQDGTWDSRSPKRTLCFQRYQFTASSHQ
jgi:hypothetical protein